MALAEVVRQEAEELVAAGVRDLQIDEPAISVRAEELALATRALGAVTEGLDSRVRTWTHVCYGEFGPVMERSPKCCYSTNHSPPSTRNCVNRRSSSL